MAEVLDDQRKIEGKVSKCEAERAELLDRLRALEINYGLARPASHKRERKVSFSMDTVDVERGSDEPPHVIA